MISASVEGRLPPYMTYPEPWRGPPKQPPELFLRPAPKPLSPATTRYNGVTTSTYPNGTRLAPLPRQVGKYPSSPSATITKPVGVNLVQAKEELVEDMSPYSPYRLYPPSPHTSQYPHFPYSLCQSSNLPTYIMRTNNFPPTPLSPIETFSSISSAPVVTSTFLPPSENLSPPSLKTSPHNIILRDKTPPAQTLTSQTINSQNHLTQNISFKVPGKEGSLKHRILVRPEESTEFSPLDLQKAPEGRKRLQASAVSPPRSPRKVVNSNSSINRGFEFNFVRGSLIQLHTGELRKLEDMRTEDFINSAERSPELRLAESTVVKIEENHQTGNATITLTYNNRRAQVEVESPAEHPYFVIRQGWASCNPERTQQLCGLKVHQLQVGDVLVSLTPRERPPGASKTSTIMTTATRTSMTARQQHPVCTVTKTQQIPDLKIATQTQPINLHHSSKNYPPQCLSPESMAARKRRWSAPDQICDEEEQNANRRHRVE